MAEEGFASTRSVSQLCLKWGIPSSDWLNSKPIDKGVKTKAEDLSVPRSKSLN